VVLLSGSPERTSALVSRSTAPANAALTAEPQPPARLDAATSRAKQAFSARCAGCHSLGAGRVIGPDLAGVTLRRTDAWLARWLKAPELMLQTDENARALAAQFGTPMPNPRLTDAQVRELIDYFHRFDARPAARAPYATTR
jgi:nitrite reductase (NO-forming)